MWFGIIEEVDVGKVIKIIVVNDINFFLLMKREKKKLGLNDEVGEQWGAYRLRGH